MLSDSPPGEGSGGTGSGKGRPNGPSRGEKEPSSLLLLFFAPVLLLAIVKKGHPFGACPKDCATCLIFTGVRRSVAPHLQRRFEELGDGGVAGDAVDVLEHIVALILE